MRTYTHVYKLHDVYIILLSQSHVYNYLVFSYTTDSEGKSFKAIGLMACLVGVTKYCELALLILPLIFLKLAINYSYSNDYSPFHQFYSDLKIFQNCPLLIKGYCLEKISHL